MATTLIGEQDGRGFRIFIYKETALDAPSIGAAAVGLVNLTVTGVTTSDKILYAMIHGAPSAAGVVISGAFCQAAGNVRFQFSNPSAGTVDLAAAEVIFAVLKLS